jgi:hypothetical protein
MSQDETDLVDARARRLSRLLRDTDPPVPAMVFPAERIARATRHRSVVRWRAAAAVVLVAAGAIGVRPVRAWIVQAARAVWAAAVGGRGERGPARIPPLVAAGTVTFAPAPGSFVVRVVRPQAGGTLTVETTTGATASAVVAGGADAELVVLPDGLKIVNDSLSSASFVVKVPARLARIEVTIAGRLTWVLVPPPGGAGTVGRWVVDLGAGR